MTSSISICSWNVRQGLNPSKLSVVDTLMSLSDVICLQETGHLSVELKELLVSQGFNLHESVGRNAGVCILLRNRLAPQVRKQFVHSVDGRAAGVLLDTGKLTILVVSAYLPTGLDSVSLDHEDALLARDIYSQIVEWSQHADLVLLGGDLNETLSLRDRCDSLGNSTGGSGKIVRSSLLRNGFVDCFRLLHPDPQSEEDLGFTCFRAAQQTKSRIDYVLMKGRAEVSKSCVIPIDNESDHRPLLCEITLPCLLHSQSQPKPLRIPNLHKATDEIKTRMCDVFDSALDANFISELKLVDSKEKLDQLAMRVNDLGWRAAKVLPLTGGPPRRSPVMKRLEE